MVPSGTGVTQAQVPRVLSALPMCFAWLPPAPTGYPAAPGVTQAQVPGVLPALPMCFAWLPPAPAWYPAASGVTQAQVLQSTASTAHVLCLPAAATTGYPAAPRVTQAQVPRVPPPLSTSALGCCCDTYPHTLTFVFKEPLRLCLPRQQDGEVVGGSGSGSMGASTGNSTAWRYAPPSAILSFRQMFRTRTSHQAAVAGVPRAGQSVVALESPAEAGRVDFFHKETQ